jgi:hypothetical protein
VVHSAAPRGGVAAHRRRWLVRGAAAGRGARDGRGGVDARAGGGSGTRSAGGGTAGGGCRRARLVGAHAHRTPGAESRPPAAAADKVEEQAADRTALAKSGAVAGGAGARDAAANVAQAPPPAAAPQARLADSVSRERRAAAPSLDAVSVRPPDRAIASAEVQRVDSLARRAADSTAMPSANRLRSVAPSRPVELSQVVTTAGAGVAAPAELPATPVAWQGCWISALAATPEDERGVEAAARVMRTLPRAFALDTLPTPSSIDARGGWRTARGIGGMPADSATTGRWRFDRDGSAEVEFIAAGERVTLVLSRKSADWPASRATIARSAAGREGRVTVRATRSDCARLP